MKEKHISCINQNESAIDFQETLVMMKVRTFLIEVIYPNVNYNGNKSWFIKPK